jgi:outer membrane protein assembly factor BamB
MIGEPSPGKPIQSVPHGFRVFPKSGSLRMTMHAMNSPEIGRWSLKYTDSFYNHDWTEECQGLTTDGTNMFIVSNNDSHRAIHKFTMNWEHIWDTVYPYRDMVKVSVAHKPGTKGGIAYKDISHIGAPDYYKGKIYVPVEGTKARVWVLDTNLNSLDRFDLGAYAVPPQKLKMPWLAINPWNELLYSSISGDEGVPVSRLYAYELKYFTHVEEKDIILKDGFLNMVSGGCFSNNGHIFLASDDTRSLHAYSILNGHYYGSCGVPSDWDEVLASEEMEGIAFYPINTDRGEAFVHAVVLDNDRDDPFSVGNDDVYLKHFTVPSPDVL